ncbi:hypothetical protein B7R22_16990 [Subtercola boreus]|uniref:DUF2303 domain-containing protein n=1 Tax=Subtercola boreus TaxID=120213 RepID=A0A3E0VTA9_9MICO|nr:DUF2303 family protein [Subtercola boreus]RFA12127.1 hypothetical protein B7R22_16990 [Subtercola boreus]
MKDIEVIIASAKTEAGTVAALAAQASVPVPLEPGTVYAKADGAGDVRVVDTDEYANTPRRAIASRVVTDAASFVKYIEKHGTEATEVWADTSNSAVVAVIDAHEGAGKPAGWQGHELELKLEKTQSWLAWNALNGKLVSQLDFAEFIENRTLDVKEPDAATLLEVAHKFVVKKGVDFESGERSQDGQTRLEYKETITGKVGQKGTIAVPNELLLVLKPYVGGPSYHVYAKFRYRLNGADLVVGIVLVRPRDILDAAFADVVTAIRDGAPEESVAGDKGTVIVTKPAHAGITQPIFNGTPA